MTKMASDILIKPLLVEKVLRDPKQHRYAFWVATNTNKKEIKWAVEEMFKVEVQKVWTVSVKSKPKRTRLLPSHTPHRKKAIIALKSGQRIDILENL